MSDKNRYKVVIPDLTLEEAVAAIEVTSGLVIFTDQDGRSRGEQPSTAHGPIRSLHCWPSSNEATIVVQE